MKHEEMIRECIAQEGITASENEVRLLDCLLTIADSFEDLGRKHKAEGLPALSEGELRQIIARHIVVSRNVETEFYDLIETYYMSGYEEGSV